MGNHVVIPGWAAALFLASVPIIIGFTSWFLKYLNGQIHDDLKSLAAKIDANHATLHSYNARLVRLETFVYSRLGMTPPTGVPFTGGNSDR